MAKRINLRRAHVARSNTIRHINRQIILNYIREEGPISRADISKITALQRSTVSLIVDELLKKGLIDEVYGESSGGRPPQLLSLKTKSAIAIGVAVGKRITIVGTSDLSGRLLEKQEFATSRDLDTTIERIIKSVKYFISKDTSTIEGIGISLPGLVESQEGEVLNIPHLDWKQPKIADVIRNATGLPVLVDNDTNAAALAELWIGRPEISDVRDFIVVLVDKGIGTGVVFDGQIYRGKGGIAGEFGHMTIGKDAPIACAAGRYDCWEAFASERAAVARYEAIKGRDTGKEKIRFERLVDLALKGDKPAVTALRETARYIGIGISNLIQGLSPELTIVTGSIVRAWPLISEDVIEGAESSICQGYPTVNIIPSSLGAYPSLMGAFSLVLADKFSVVSMT